MMRHSLEDFISFFSLLLLLAFCASTLTGCSATANCWVLFVPVVLTVLICTIMLSIYTKNIVKLKNECSCERSKDGGIGVVLLRVLNWLDLLQQMDAGGKWFVV